jgi:hypothetical protein
MRQIFIYIFFLAVSHVCIAQFSIGLESGYSYNHLNTNISNRDFTENNNKSGYGLGVRIKYDFTSLFSIMIDVGYIQKNYSFDRTDNYEGIHETFTNVYLHIPLRNEIRIFEKGNFKTYFNYGIYLAYWLTAKETGIIPNIYNSTSEVGSDGQITQYFSFTSYSSNYNLNTLRDNRFEFGLVSGLDISYTLNNKYSIFLEASFYQSLTDQQKKYMVNQISKINQTFCISIGCMIKLPFNKKLG